MVSALESGSGGPGSSLGQGAALCSWARHFTLIVPLSTQVYKWVPANLLLVLVASCYGNRDKLRSGLMGPLARRQTLPFYIYCTIREDNSKTNCFASCISRVV